jgi:predicted nucleic acid-binding Zn ribbon protein
MKDDPLKVCPQCKEEKLRRLFGCGAAVIFKGSGFYETDYRSESYKSAAKADQEASKPSSTTTTNTNGTSGTSTSNTSSNGAATSSKSDGAKTG